MVSKIFNLNIYKYFFVSCFVSIIDFIISYLLYRLSGMTYMVASNTGIIIGFLVQYFLCSKYIFKNDRNLGSFFVYVMTFISGIFLSDLTLWISYDRLGIYFTISKCLSMATPFFITYFIRQGVFGRRG
ncbi:membrane protein [Clostridium acetobutylicum EA 2018]|nr:GtrA family protein [Clostridium acetobutylicum]ADZ21577.1 membrane protein [Clostridium acetobutylicum EA 2018]AEI32411.1 membrane protein [Clostridium acetobutylicum DSM 1731]PSM07064.1 GtrA family protein [Clostridium sp. NJ4]AWV79104.1 GtrA family protein [Clostridium acetobutylicum]MBC2394935.1 GtrA family protein [Clostridium acetobutylicum]